MRAIVLAEKGKRVAEGYHTRRLARPATHSPCYARLLRREPQIDSLCAHAVAILEGVCGHKDSILRARHKILVGLMVTTVSFVPPIET